MALLRVLCFVLLVGFAATCPPYCPKCPPMWTFYNGNCYRYFGTVTTFAEAEQHCQMFYQGSQGHLASISSVEENNLLFTMWNSIRGTTDVNMWIGLNDRAEEGSFVWTDGSEVSYTNWNDVEPTNTGGNEHCVHFGLDRSDRWNDHLCNQEFSYVCKMATTE